MMVIDANRDYWPPAVSDGLTLPCVDCERYPSVDYRVADDEWVAVTPNPLDRPCVICLECFVFRGGDATKIEEVQVIGEGATALFHPGRAYRWETPDSGPAA